MYYAQRAYLDTCPENAKALFVMGVAARLRLNGTLPDTIPTVPLNEADIMLLRSAQLGYDDALRAIRCLNAHNQWHHSLPEQLEK